MPASFREIFANAGVDEDARPNPGMIVPRGGSNVVRLVGGRDLKVVAPAPLKIKELVSPAVASIAGTVLTAIAAPAALFGKALPVGLADSRIFQVSGPVMHGRIPAQVKAINPRTSKVEALLAVAVIAARKIKLSVRPVQIRNPQGAITFHSKKPFAVKELVETMNSIWTPQANVVFDLVSSDPVLIDDGAEIARILDLKTQTVATLPSMVVIQRFEGLLNKYKDKNADLTMFLVEGVGNVSSPGARYSSATSVAGSTNPVLGIALIGDSRTLQPDVMAHEAGHFLGSFVGQGGHFVSFGHKGDRSALMHEGGSLVDKIPFRDTIDYFNKGS